MEGADRRPRAKPRVIRWKGQNDNPGLSVGLAADETVRWIEKVTNGRLKIDLVPAPGIVPVAQSFDALSKGLIDCVMPAYGAFYAQHVPEAVILPGPPFAWDRIAHVYDAYYNRGLYEVAQVLHAKHNVYFVPQIMGGIRFLGCTFPCTSINDLKGKKIRAVGTDRTFLEKLGATTVFMPGPDIHRALESGAVEATLSNLSILPKFMDVWRYCVISPNYGGGIGALLFNLNSWNSLPADIKHVLDNDLRYQSLVGGLNSEVVLQRTMIEARTKYGTQFVAWSAEDTAKAIQVAMPLYDDLAQISVEAKKMIEIIKQQMKDLGKLK